MREGARPEKVKKEKKSPKTRSRFDEIPFNRWAREKKKKLPVPTIKSSYSTTERRKEGLLPAPGRPRTTHSPKKKKGGTFMETLASTGNRSPLSEEVPIQGGGKKKGIRTRTKGGKEESA